VASPLGGRRLGDRTEDNLNLNFVQIAVTKFDNLVKALLPDVRLGLSESQVVPLDHRTADRPFPLPIALDTLLQGHVE